MSELKCIKKLFTWFRNRLVRTEMDYDSLFEMGVKRDEKNGYLNWTLVMTVFI
ncbi:MAG: hypothetical protein CM1200mP30_06280 [Pseudomonadota bacterium]|nr:MAG: hypothetical protein CM1200mP30_06280 [Pseudomonadota bacterium]